MAIFEMLYKIFTKYSIRITFAIFGVKISKKLYGIANIKKYTDPKSSIILLYYDAMASSKRVSLEKTYKDVIKKSFFCECQ